MDDGVLGVCQRPENQSAPGEPSLWESQMPWERRAKKAVDTFKARHVKARIECSRCPLLEPCERYLSDMEERGLRVDGVVAGRYSDVSQYGYSKPRDEIGNQSRCRVCREFMWPRAAPPDKLTPDIPRQHQGEGLCDLCHRRFSRQERRKAS